jgi:nitrate reductase delta subunit
LALTLGRPKKSVAEQAALDRIRDWTRTRFALGPDMAILATEIECRTPGCPPIETIVAFWSERPEGDGSGEPPRRHHFKIFKPAVDVAEDDLPPAFMKTALAETEMFGCPCC